MGSFSIYNWRILIFKSDLPANAKYIGCYLSTYMNEHGDNCYPSIKRICHETGLSNKTVIKYIQVLRDENWLEAKKKGFDGQAWAHNQYYPNVPIKVVEELHCVDKGGVTEGERQCISGHKAVEEVHTSSIDNSTVSSIKERDYPNELNLSAWKEYIDYRKEAKIRKLTKSGEGKQIEKIIGYGGYDVQQQCINETIANGWQGIFPQKKKLNGERNGNKKLNAVEQVESATRNKPYKL